MSEKIEVCSSDALEDGGIGHRFKVLYNGEETSAFLIRADANLRGFLNRCSHVPVELDWNYGEFLDDSKQIIVCATHGASYSAESGACLGGPCDGSPLVKLDIFEQDGKVFWRPTETITVPPEGIEE